MKKKVTNGAVMTTWRPGALAPSTVTDGGCCCCYHRRLIELAGRWWTCNM